MSTTARLQLPYPELADGPDGADVPYWIEALAQALDVAAIDDQGILSSRPPAGIKGRYYMVKGDGTPANNGVLWRDNGTTWDQVGPIAAGSIGTTQLADGAVTEAKLALLSVGTGELQTGAVTQAKIALAAIDADRLADALKPSTGAGGGTEALRAIGSGAGQVVAGNDARLTDQRVPTDGSVTSAKLASTTGSGAVVLAASPALTGTPTGPNAALNANSSQLATTAFVISQVAPVTYLGAPANPGSTVSTTRVMAGLSGQIGPTKTGVVVVHITGTIENSVGGAADGMTVAIKMGTGTAPTNGAALTGTSYGTEISTDHAVAALPVPFTCVGIATGLTPGTAYWIDLAFRALTSGTVQIKNVTIAAYEL